MDGKGLVAEALQRLLYTRRLLLVQSEDDDARRAALGAALSLELLAVLGEQLRQPGLLCGGLYDLDMLPSREGRAGCESERVALALGS